MARYKLLAGMHIEADKRRPILDADGEETGRYHKRVYRAGDTVESETDLVAKHGPQRFEAVGSPEETRRIAELEKEIAALKAKAAQSAGGFRTPGDPTPENLIQNPSVAPGGQVSTGFQGGDKLDQLSDDELDAVFPEEEISELDKGATRAEKIQAIRDARRDARQESARDRDRKPAGGKKAPNYQPLRGGPPGKATSGSKGAKPDG